MEYRRKDSTESCIPGTSTTSSSSQKNPPKGANPLMAEMQNKTLKKGSQSFLEPRREEKPASSAEADELKAALERRRNQTAASKRKKTRNNEKNGKQRQNVVVFRSFHCFVSSYVLSSIFSHFLAANTITKANSGPVNTATPFVALRPVDKSANGKPTPPKSPAPPPRGTPISKSNSSPDLPGLHEVAKPQEDTPQIGIR